MTGQRRRPSRGGVGITLYCARDDSHRHDVDVLPGRVWPLIATVMREAGWAVVRGRVLCPECLFALGYDAWGEKLSDVILDGLACCYCGSTRGAMEPDATGPRGRLFAHPGCRDE